MSVGDLHRWRCEQIERCNQLMSELTQLLERRRQRDDHLIAEALATGRAAWDYVDLTEDRRIEELRQTIADYRRVDLFWRSLPALDDDGQPR